MKYLKKRKKKKLDKRLNALSIKVQEQKALEEVRFKALEEAIQPFLQVDSNSKAVQSIKDKIAAHKSDFEAMSADFKAMSAVLLNLKSENARLKGRLFKLRGFSKIGMGDISNIHNSKN